MLFAQNNIVEKPKQNILHTLHDTLFPSHRNNYHPNILHQHHLNLVAVFLVIVKVFFFSLYLFAPAGFASSAAITVENVYNLTNEARVIEGVGKLTYNDKLAVAAQAKAEHMLKHQYFAHYDESGRSPWDFINESGYDYLIAGENLAVDFYQAEDVQEAWMKSPGHRANIVKKEYQEIGIGISSGVYKGHKSIFVVQMFGTPVPNKAVATKRPTPVEDKVVKTYNIAPEKKQLRFTITTNKDVQRIVLNYGTGKTELSKKSINNEWVGFVDIDKLNSKNEIAFEIIDKDGKQISKPAGSLDGNSIQSMILGEGQTSKLQVFGFNLNSVEVEYMFFGLVTTFFLVLLLISIAVKRHYQHISLISNTAFMIVFCLMLWQYF